MKKVVRIYSLELESRKMSMRQAMQKEGETQKLVQMQHEITLLQKQQCIYAGIISGIQRVLAAADPGIMPFSTW